MGKTTLGVIVGNRGFFPDALVREGREEVLRVLEGEGYGVVCLGPEETKHGAVETLEEARKCAELFKRHREEIEGVVVTLPNFGDERGVANALRMSGLEVPVLVQAYPDEAGKMLMGGAAGQFLREDIGVQQSVAVRDSVHADAGAHGVAGVGGVQGGFEDVCGDVPGGEGFEGAAGGGDRGAAGGVQHGAVQREAAGAGGDNGGDGGFIGGGGEGGAAGRRGREGEGEAGGDTGVCEDGRDSGGVADEDGEVWGGGGGVDGGERIGGDVGAVLDGDGGVFWGGAVHADEHDVEQSAAERVRDGHDGDGGDVRAAVGVGEAERDSGLEQQLWGGPGQVRDFSLFEPAEGVF